MRIKPKGLKSMLLKSVEPKCAKISLFVILNSPKHAKSSVLSPENQPPLRGRGRVRIKNIRISYEFIKSIDSINPMKMEEGRMKEIFTEWETLNFN